MRKEKREIRKEEIFVCNLILIIAVYDWEQRLFSFLISLFSFAFFLYD